MKGLALVSGASRGLGFAMAEALCATHHVIAVARTIGALEELDDRIKAGGGSVTLAPLDIRDPQEVTALCERIRDRWGKLDIWLHCAVHAAPLSPAPFVDAEDWRTSIDINATATSMMIACVAPFLGSSGLAVFFDTAGTGRKFHGAYDSSKAAQIALARSWQAESRRTGPRVVILEPRPMATATRARFFPGENRNRLSSPADEAVRLLDLIDLP